MRRQQPPARRALQKALLDQIGLDDLLDRVARLGQRRGDRLDADRPAAVILGDRRQIAPVQRIEPARVDFEPLERLVGDLAVDWRRRPSTMAKSRTRRSSRPAMRGVPRERRAISLAPSVGHADAEHARAARDDQLEFLARCRNSAAPECRSGRAAAWSAAPRASSRRPA